MASGNLGGLYRDGSGVRKDLKEAARLFRKGIEQGDHFSMLKLGFLYKEGQGVPRSDTEALRLFNQAAQKNNTDAMYQLGLFATLGRGGPKDATTAANWLVKAIAGGNNFSLTEMTTNSGAWGAPFRAAVQVELKQRGLYNGPVNGTFGSSTIAALKQLAGG